jgi:hypothetical protein
MKKLFNSLVMFAVAFFASLSVQAQTTGSLTGTITDPNGAVVAGANVTLKNNSTGVETTAVTGSNGAFTFTALQPGSYSVIVAASGFKRVVATDVGVAVAVQSQVSITLEVGLADETVTVTATQDVINTLSPSLSNVINTRQVVDLPLPTRNPLELAALQAGIAVTGSATRTSSIAGLRGSATNVTQDGINAMDNFVKTDSLFAISAPTLNSVGEFSITTGTVGSEAGRGVGQVNVVTKGGTNDYHGGIFYLHRNDALNANNFFSNISGTPRAREREHYFGFDIGGPIYFLNFGDGGGPSIWNGKDKAFFFFTYEGFRENFSVTRNRTVLTPEARNGIFRYTVGGVTQSVDLLQIGNVHVLNPITMSFINSTPTPNNTEVGDGLNTAGARFNVTGSDVQDKFVGRYDHQIVKEGRFGGHKFEFVYSRADFNLSPDTFNGLESPFPGGINAFQGSKRTLFTGALVSTFGNKTNVFRYGRQFAPVGFLLESNPSQEQNVVYTGITGPHPLNGPPFLSQGRNTVVDQYSDNFSWSKGPHLLRFGGDYQKVFADTFNDVGILQSYNLGENSLNPSGIVLGDFPGLTNNTTGNAIVARAIAVYSNIVGNLGTSSLTFNVSSPDSGFVSGATRARLFQQRLYSAYGQDQWRMMSNLTLSFGLRWEFHGVPTIPNGLAIQPEADDVFGISGPGNLFNPNAPAGASPGVASLRFVSGDTGIPLYNNDWNNFAPFVGIAYSPSFEGGIGKMLFGSAGKSSFRAGYAISYLQDGFTVISNAMGTGATNAGLIQTVTNTTPTGVFTAAGVPITTPTFQIPITDRQNFLISSTNGLWGIDPNLTVPYVQQWNVGIEREIFKDTALEIRYVGNRASDVWRAFDVNEVNIFENGFLDEFLRAQGNLAACVAAGTVACRAAQTAAGVPANQLANSSFGNWGLPGQVPLPLFDVFFLPAGLPSSTSRALQYGNSGFVGNLNGNNVGAMASTLAFNTTYQSNRENPANGIPANFFVANPNAAFARLLTNDSWSNYHSLQVELRRRFSGGFQFQADYTFSKSLTNAADAAGSQSDLVSFRTLRDKTLDTRRSNQDQTHRFVFNSIYELPFGRGRQFGGNANGFIDRLIGGWTVGSIVTWATRPPWFVTSGRSTFNSFNPGLAPAQLVGITFEEFKKNLGVFRTPAGVFFVNPDLLDITTNSAGIANGSELKDGLMGAPAPGEWGNFPMNSLNGPPYFNVDLSLVKRLPINERVKLELKTTFINAFNYTSFAFGNQTFDSANFGRITGISGSPRVIHFTGALRF